MMRRRCLRPSSICWSAQLHASVLFQDGKVFVKKRSRPIDSPEKEGVEPLFLCTKNVMQGGLTVVGRCRRTSEDDDVLDYFAVDIPSSMNVEPFVSGCPRLHYRISRSSKLWRFDVLPKTSRFACHGEWIVNFPFKSQLLQQMRFADETNQGGVGKKVFLRFVWTGESGPCMVGWVGGDYTERCPTLCVFVTIV